MLNHLNLPTRQATSHQYPDWRAFLTETFPFLALKSFAPHQVEFWDWTWAIAPDTRPRPFVALWARGAAKSTSAELAAALVGITKRRAYIIYVSGTQDLADRHVQSIGSLLERANVERAVNKYGSSRGWQRDHLRTSTFTIDALGLDPGARGIRVDEDRPGMIVLDDVDALHDTAETTRKKIETLTETILPGGSNDCAVLFVQNLVQRDSIAARFADGRADFLQDRVVSGAYPALRDFRYENVGGELRIFGTPTWDGQNLDDCLAFIKTWGLRAFLRECQHEVTLVEGAIFSEFSRETHVKKRDKSEFQYWLLALDEGFTNPAVTLVVGVDSDIRLHVAREFYQTQVLPSRHARLTLEWAHQFNTRAAVVDPSAAGLIAELRNVGLQVEIPKEKHIERGIDVLHELLAIAGDKKPRLTIDPNCLNTITEFEMFKSIKEDPHAVSALRYLCVWLFADELETKQVIYDPVKLDDRW